MVCLGTITRWRGSRLDTYGATRINRCALFQDESVLRPAETFVAVGYPARLPRSYLIFQLSQGPQVCQ